MSYRKIADRQNAYGVTTRNGKVFYATIFKNLLALYAEIRERASVV